MATYNESDIKILFDDNLKESKNLLKTLKVFCGNEPEFNGLKGWVFEKTIQYCIREELKKKNATYDIVEQFGLGGKRKVDLKIGNITLEIKTSGFYDKEKDILEKYEGIRTAAKANGASRYVIMSLKGSSTSHWNEIRKAIGKENTFCLFFKNEPQKGEWERFIDLLCSQKTN